LREISGVTLVKVVWQDWAVEKFKITGLTRRLSRRTLEVGDLLKSATVIVKGRKR
jgi:hypothetical protein